MLHGIEIVNGARYYGRAHRIALENDLTLVAGSDEHTEALRHTRPTTGDDPRVSKDSTAAGIREALFAKRTAIGIRTS